MSVVIRDKGWNAMISRMYGCDELSSRVGYPSSTASETHEDGSGLTVLQVAAVQEFGTRDIPMRSHVRASYDENVDVLSKRAATELGAVVDGTRAPKEAIARLGEMHVADVQRKIYAGPFAPNAPATIARKKSARPLIDTGQMVQSVTHVEET